jgi:hypothetical protein
MRRLCLLLAALTALSLGLPGARALAAEYDLVIDETVVTVTGKPKRAIAVNGTVPGPVLRFKEGEDVVVRVTNRLKETSSVHWHGLLLPGDQDGAPGFNGWPASARGRPSPIASRRSRTAPTGTTPTRRPRSRPATTGPLSSSRRAGRRSRPTAITSCC